MDDDDLIPVAGYYRISHGKPGYVRPHVRHRWGYFRQRVKKVRD